jgi:hypothetical protein
MLAFKIVIEFKFKGLKEEEFKGEGSLKEEGLKEKGV